MKAGPIVALKADYNFGSYSQSTVGPSVSMVEQKIGGGGSLLGFSLAASTSRSAPQSGLIGGLGDLYNVASRSLSGVPFSPTQYEFGLKSGLPKVTVKGGGSFENFGANDVTLELGVKAFAGIEAKFNLSEFGRQIGETAFNFFNPAPVISTPRSSAAGGFLLYPNKVNNNSLMSVYAK